MGTSAKCGITTTTTLGDEIFNLTFKRHQDALEVTSLDSAGAAEFIACLKSGSGTFDSYVGSGSVGTRSGITISNDKDSVTIDILITDVEVNDDVKDKIVFNYTFETTGAITGW
jgi:hypothetical protein